MKVKIIKSGKNDGALRFADVQPHLPQATIVKGETRDDLSHTMCAQLIELGYAVEVNSTDVVEGETVVAGSIAEKVDTIINENSGDGSAIKAALAELAKSELDIDVDTSKSVKKIRASIISAAEKAGE